MVVKVTKDLLSAQSELAVARNVCTKNLKGLAVLEDDGVINDEDSAQSLGALPNSIFIVYKKVEHCLLILWESNNYSMSV